MDFKLDFFLNDEQKSFILDKNEISVGKLPGNDFFLQDNSISRNHCKLIRTDKSYKIIDLNSTNGTYVNGKKIEEKVLKPDDNITIGRSILKFLPLDRKKSITDVDDQKISVMIPLSDKFLLKKQKKETDIEEIKLMSSLTSLGKSLIASTDLENSFNEVGQFVTDILAPKRIFIFSYDTEQDNLSLMYSHVKGTKSNKKKINISKTIAMKAIREKVAILSSNAMDDSRFDGAKSIIMLGITSAISIPIWTKNTIYGLIYTDTTVTEKFFTKRDLEILSIIANFTGLSVESIKSLNKLNIEKKIRARLERYHSPAIVSKIMELQEGSTDELTGYKESVATVLFMDIVGFTSRVEHMKPIETGVFLNNFFTEMTDIIFNYNGTLDKYIGDSIMAIFGVPFEIKNHAELSIMTALDMQKKVAEMNKGLGLKEKLSIRIGINSGKLIAGDFGSPKRYDYTVIGNTVNIASRIESSVAKPDEIAISDTTRKLVKSNFIFSEIGDELLHGISKPVKVFKVIGEKKKR